MRIGPILDEGGVNEADLAAVENDLVHAIAIKHLALGALTVLHEIPTVANATAQ